MRDRNWWHPDEIETLLRTLQPGILINNRLPGCGDFDTPEQFVPPSNPGVRWESCVTMNESWGWNVDDPHYKTSRAIIHTLCETAGRGGNLLLNISPMGDGTIPPEQLERLDAVAAWITMHGSAIHGTEAGLEPWQFYGPSTRHGNRIHLFLLTRPYETITVRGLPVRRVRNVTELSSGTDLTFSSRTAILDQLRADPDGEITIVVPEELLDPMATVIAVDISDEVTG